MGILEQANKAISAAERVALASESNEQESSLFRTFFDSAVGLLSDKQRVELARLLAIDVDNEVAHEPYDSQASHVEELRTIDIQNLPTDEHDWIERALEKHHSCDINIDSDAEVSVGDEGAWVQAWVFVNK